jgi:hypothetical protein
MKTPINCPFCGDILRSDYTNSYEGISILQKKCDKKLNHKITFHPFVGNEDYVNYIDIPLVGNSYIQWFLGAFQVEIITDGKLDVALPWFEPDLSNFTKLMNKIKTYLLFS